MELDAHQSHCVLVRVGHIRDYELKEPVFFVAELLVQDLQQLAHCVQQTPELCTAIETIAWRTFEVAQLPHVPLNKASRLADFFVELLIR